MRWIKANHTSKKEKKGKRSTPDDMDDNARTVIVFNPLLWKEEIVNLIED